MKTVRFRERSWRYYRNWLILVFMLGALVVGALWSPWHVLLIWALPAYFVGSAIFYAYRFTHPGAYPVARNLTPAQADLAYEIVEFPSRDGLQLFGWFVPSPNRAVIVLVHGFGSQGISMIYHANALAAHGYGSLMFDLRAHGSSEGDTCTWGWREINDLLGAVDYLQSRDDVDADKIGVLGISLGGQIALRAAAESTAIRGVVAEGPSVATLADHGGRPTTLRRWINYPINWLNYAMLSLMNGVRPPAGVLATIGRIAPRPLLLISTGRGGEQRVTRLFYQAAAEPKELWEIPEGKHAGGFFARPEAYAEKITRLFETAFAERL